MTDPALGQILPEFNPKKATLSNKFIKSGFMDLKDIVLAPANWQSKEWILLGGLSIGTGILFKADEGIIQWFQDNRNPQRDRFVQHFIEPWGGEVYKNYTVYSIIGTYAIGLAFKDEQSKKVAMLATKSIILAGVFNGISKAAFGRFRPYQTQDNDPFNWQGPNLDGFYSFPSGHTMSVWVVAAVFAEEYKAQLWVPLTAYTLASAVGISRIYDNKHWASDVLVGAVFGWAIGKTVTKNNNWGLTVSTLGGNPTIGIAIHL
jgi:hypothetical protein